MYKVYSNDIHYTSENAIGIVQFRRVKLFGPERDWITEHSANESS